MSATVPQPTSEGPVTRNAATLCEAFQATAAAPRRSGRAAHRRRLDRDDVWREYADARASAIAAGLAALGVGARRHGRAAADATGPSSTSSTRRRSTSARRRSRSTTPRRRSRSPTCSATPRNRVVVTERAFLERVCAARGDSAEPSHASCCVDGDADGRDLARASSRPPATADFDFEAGWRAVEPGDVATLIYTSGTTGPAEGRGADARQPARRVPRGRRRCCRSEPARPHHLLPAHRAHRRPLVLALQPAMRLRRPDHLRGRPARGRGGAARAPPDALGRGAAGGGEAQGRARGGAAHEHDEPAREAVRGDRAGRQKVRLEQAGEPVPAELAAGRRSWTRGAVEAAREARPRRAPSG